MPAKNLDQTLSLLLNPFHAARTSMPVLYITIFNFPPTSQGRYKRKYMRTDKNDGNSFQARCQQRGVLTSEQGEKSYLSYLLITVILSCIFRVNVYSTCFILLPVHISPLYETENVFMYGHLYHRIACSICFNDFYGYMSYLSRCKYRGP